MATGPFSKIYHALMDEYAEVFADPVLLGTYAQLLVAAEKFYPQRPPLPPRTKAYLALVEAGLVLEDIGRRSYTVRGLVAERERRSNAARIANAVRWGVRSESGAESGSHPTSVPRREREEERREEKNASDSNGLPQSFMHFRQKEPKPGLHDGHHGQSCQVCFPVTT